jgi:hypothetical protein
VTSGGLSKGWSLTFCFKKLIIFISKVDRRPLTKFSVPTAPPGQGVFLLMATICREICNAGQISFLLDIKTRIRFPNRIVEVQTL